VRWGRLGLGWWTGELLGLVPRGLAGRLFGEGNVLRLFVRGDAVVSAMGEDCLDHPAAGSLAEALRAADMVVLVLPAQTVLRRVVDIPVAASRELAAAAPFLAERHMPFPPGQARLAWRRVAPPGTGGRVRVELAATASAPLDRLLERLDLVGIHPSRLLVEGDEARPQLDFGAGARRGRSARWRDEPWRSILAASLALAVLGPLLVSAVVHVRAERLAAALPAQGANTLDAGRTRDAFAKAEAAAGVLAARVKAADPLRVLDQLSAALPDTAWAFSFDYTPASVEIGGFSGDMAGTVGRLQSIPGANRLEFRSAVIHDAKTDRDRFDILLHLDSAAHATRISP
jgi:general secretion pathway protein L